MEQLPRLRERTDYRIAHCPITDWLVRKPGAFAIQRCSQTFVPAKARQMCSLLDSGFLDRNENILVFGNPGSGQTKMLQAVSQELARQGHRMLFTTREMLVQDLLIAKREHKLSCLLKQYWL